MNLIEKAALIAEELKRIYPEKIEFLDFENSYQLLITVILTAQTTDKQVMKITPALFKKYPEPSLLGKACAADVEEIIRSTGFYRVKAINIIRTASIIAEKYRGEVPDTIDELVTLPGVGRKSANVITGTLFSKPAVIVDTHFRRVVKRVGLTEKTDPDRIEAELREIINPEKQYRFSMSVNLHGRVICHSRKPECGKCGISRYCDHFIREVNIKGNH